MKPLLPQRNTIILTTGSSGSSVLAGILGTKGYWLGERTKQIGFDTYENAELVDLNIELLRLSGFNRRDCNDIPPPSIGKMKVLADSRNIERFRLFVEKCNTRGPWLWKDPRLSYTIHFWKSLLDLNAIDFIFIEREPRQSYAGLLLKRQVPMSYAQHNLMNQQYKQSCKQFFAENSLQFLHITFEKLLAQPDRCLEEIGSHLNFNLTINDLQRVYRGELQRKRWPVLYFYKAVLFYFGYRYILRDYIKFPRTD